MSHLNMLVYISSYDVSHREYMLPAHCETQHPAMTRRFVLWVAYFKDMFGPEKNAVLSLGVGSDETHPCPVVVRTCWSWTTFLLFFFFFLQR